MEVLVCDDDDVVPQLQRHQLYRTCVDATSVLIALVRWQLHVERSRSEVTTAQHLS
jgi:hypothetical protein